MKKMIEKFLIIGMFICTLFFVSMQVSAETSEYSVTYGEEITSDTENSCEVLISIPYTYSETIPKAPSPTHEPDKVTQKPVQTGDGTPILGYSILTIVSLSGIGSLVINKKKNK